jgi:hypothetical protein
MKKHFYILVLILALLLPSKNSTCQTIVKYEYTTICYNSYNTVGNMYVSIGGDVFEKTEIKLIEKDERNPFNFIQIQKKIAEFTEEGWELVELTLKDTSGLTTHYAWLRRKIV